METNIFKRVWNRIRYGASGRVGRMGYALSYVPYLTLTTIAPYELKSLTAILGLALVAFAGSKRCHDAGIRGAWILLIPIVPLILLFWPGQKHENRFGPAL